MPQIQAVSPGQHAHHSWLPYTEFKFAAEDAFAPLLVHEFMLAGALTPVAFALNGDEYSPTLMMGLQTGTNLLVSAKHKWMVTYVPAYYRSHPFCMARDQDGKTLLSVHADSPYVLNHYEPGGRAKPFFTGTQLSADLQAIRKFLQQVEASRQITRSFCAACAKHQLFSPWEPEVKTGKQVFKIKGLHRIDETRLKALPADTVKMLVDTGAMAAIYYHLGSLQHIQSLANLKQRRDSASDPAVKGAPMPAILTEDPSADLIDLDWNAIIKRDT